ncbi:hypothetical protein V5O48_014427 [Marasmius crinis-equi]|uniref:Amine oxidase domain-containing protein n=1 Tax=Marasmius crinis-equi TaxID=585013 RepID=A0ABR3EXC1_9AGAR
MQFSDYSTRGYMLNKLGFSPAVVDWLETFLTQTGMYDISLVESVLEMMDLGPGIEDRWNYIDGGSEHIIPRMADRITRKPITGMRVTGVASVRDGEEGAMILEVTILDQEKNAITKRHYSQVISTVPLPCLATMDIPRSDLSYAQYSAIRSLSYSGSTKVALRFAKRWWEDPDIMDGKPIHGGSSSTDLPIRWCIYPPYGLSSKCSELPGTLLASYTWVRDSQRLGSLSESQILDVTLRNLSDLHGIPISSFGEVEDHIVWNWQTDEHVLSGFALFGPSQFHSDSGLFASMKVPAAGGLLHFGGEATSVHHGWVGGALNSAWRAVSNVLSVCGEEEKREKFLKEWIVPDEEAELLPCYGLSGFL